MKNTQTLQYLIPELNNLNQEELIEIKNRIDYLLLEFDKSKLYDDTRTRQFYDVIQSCLLKELGIEKRAFSIFKKSNNFNKFKKSYKDLDVYMKSININNKKSINYKFYLLFIKLLIDWLQECSIPISLSTVINNMNKIPGLLNQAYPDYIKNGLIHLIK